MLLNTHFGVITNTAVPSTDVPLEKIEEQILILVGYNKTRKMCFRSILRGVKRRYPGARQGDVLVALLNLTEKGRLLFVDRPSFVFVH